MAHFASIDENNKVIAVYVVDNNDCGGGIFPESELIGQQFLKNLGFNDNLKQTSYNNNFRGRYGEVGFFYDEAIDEFIEPLIKSDEIIEI